MEPKTVEKLEEKIEEAIAEVVVKIFHSRADDVVPFADSEELVSNSGANLIEVGKDHRLADPEPLAAMLRGCGG